MTNLPSLAQLRSNSLDGFEADNESASHGVSKTLMFKNQSMKISSSPSKQQNPGTGQMDKLEVDIQDVESPRDSQDGTVREK